MNKFQSLIVRMFLVFLVAAMAVRPSGAQWSVTVSVVTSNPMELLPCLKAITSPAQPTKECCVKLKEQVPCLCGYMKNPTFKPYVDSPNAKRVAKTCRVVTPKC